VVVQTFRLKDSLNFKTTAEINFSQKEILLTSKFLMIVLVMGFAHVID